jgi:pyruvate formate lyase activating enzyme
MCGAGVPPPDGSTAGDTALGGIDERPERTVADAAFGGIDERPERTIADAAFGGIVFGGAHWTTVIDYPGIVAATLFTVGCNLRCPFCHNPELVDPDRFAPTLDSGTILERLKERAGFLDGIVITGGEPTIHPGLATLAVSLQELGYCVKLDTNGTRPDVLFPLLAELREEDYVAMDVKAPLDRYAEIAGIDVDAGAIEASIERIVEAAPDYEFRTTVAPTLEGDDIRRIAECLHAAGARRFFLQPFRVPETGLLDPTWADRTALSVEEIESVWDEIRTLFDDGGVRS